nr:hypothetical protein [Halopenitus persicus]
MSVPSEVREVDADQISFNDADRRTRNLAVECPRLELDAWCDGNRRVDSSELELPDGSAILLVDLLRNVILAAISSIEGSEELVRIEIQIPVFAHRTEVTVFILVLLVG